MNAGLEARLVELARAGESFTAIAASLGISRVHAGRIARRHGFTRRDGRWNGGRRITAGYVQVLCPDHPLASRGYVMEHVLVAERALGRTIPRKHPVHHVNGRRQDNRPGNLVICENARYHQLLHQRARALRECGHADWLKCEVCHQWDDPAYLSVRHNRRVGRHHTCHSRSENRRRALAGGADLS